MNSKLSKTEFLCPNIPNSLYMQMSFTHTSIETRIAEVLVTLCVHSLFIIASVCEIFSLVFICFALLQHVLCLC